MISINSQVADEINMINQFSLTKKHYGSLSLRSYQARFCRFGFYQAKHCVMISTQLPGCNVEQLSRRFSEETRSMLFSYHQWQISFHRIQTTYYKQTILAGNFDTIFDSYHGNKWYNKCSRKQIDFTPAQFYCATDCPNAAKPQSQTEDKRFSDAVMW